MSIDAQNSMDSRESLIPHSQRRLIQDEEEEEEVVQAVNESQPVPEATAENRAPIINNNNSNNPVGINLHARRAAEARRLLQQEGTRTSANAVNLAQMWRRGNFVFILYFIPLTVALVTVLIVDWNKTCDRPLKEWAVTQVCLQVLLLGINFIVLNKLPHPDEPANVQEQRMRSLSVYYILNRILNLIWFIWFVVGMVWTFEALANDSCSVTAPFLFRMCYALIIIQLVLIGLMVLFCCCSCLVVLLRVFVYPPGVINTSRGASERAIKALPTKKFESSQNQIAKDDANCAICLSDYEQGEEIRYLPCNHHFHSACVDQWLTGNNSCPFCKREIEVKNPTEQV